MRSVPVTVVPEREGGRAVVLEQRLVHEGVRQRQDRLPATRHVRAVPTARCSRRSRTGGRVAPRPHRGPDAGRPGGEQVRAPGEARESGMGKRLSKKNATIWRDRMSSSIFFACVRTPSWCPACRRRPPGRGERRAWSAKRVRQPGGHFAPGDPLHGGVSRDGRPLLHAVEELRGLEHRLDHGGHARCEGDGGRERANALVKVRRTSSISVLATVRR